MSDPLEHKAASLRKMQTIATGCVGAAFAIRLGTAYMPDVTWVGYLRAFSEAAVVGGLADWFAVTALFRHPLGLPIPHTRILPRGKDRLAKSLSTFVVTNFLNRDVVERELLKVDLSAKAADYLETKSEVIAGKMTEYLPRVLDAMDDEDISRFLQAQFTQRIRKVNVTPIAGKMIDLLTSGDKHVQIVDDLLKIGSDALGENSDILAEMVQKEIPVPDSLNVPGIPIGVPLGKVKEKLSAMIAKESMKRILSTIEDVRQNPQHEIRKRIRGKIATLSEELKQSPEMIARGEEMKNEFLSNPNVSDYASDIWKEIKLAIQEDAQRPNSQIRQHLTNALKRIAHQVKDDEKMRHKFNNGIRSAGLDIIIGNAPQFAKIIEDTVSRWDGEELSNKLELEVGRDLQFVRLNGTLVGGLLGLLLHLLSSFLSIHG